MSRRSHLLQRSCAAALAVLWLAMPLLGLLHAGEHAHRYCPEHQALEEVAAAPADVASMAPWAGAEGSGATGLAAGVGAEAEHVQCALAWATPRQAWLPARSEPIELGEPCNPQVLAEGQGRGPAVPLLALAPKASPPHC